MRFELVIILIAGFIMANIYTDGRYVRLMMTWKKYYQMVGVAFGALMLYILLKNKYPGKIFTNSIIEYIESIIQKVFKTDINIVSWILLFLINLGFCKLLTVNYNLKS